MTTETATTTCSDCYDLWNGRDIGLCKLHAAAPALLAALANLLDAAQEAGVSDGTFDESETGDECCAICTRPTYIDCIEDEPCGIARAAIVTATTDR